MEVAGQWRYVYRAVDQNVQFIDVHVSNKRDTAAATKFFTVAIAAHHDTTQYANNRVENDHGRLKARLRPMRGLQTDRTASVVIRGHAFMQNLRRGRYELGEEAHPGLRIAAAFDELARAV